MQHLKWGAWKSRLKSPPKEPLTIIKRQERDHFPVTHSRLIKIQVGKRAQYLNTTIRLSPKHT